MKRVAFQGERGAFSEAAAGEYFGEPIDPVACETFDQVFALLSGGECDHGIIPIENSLAGSIHQNYDLLQRSDAHITGEHILRVEHCLIANPGLTLHDIRTVRSHPQALAQCDRFIQSHGFKREVAYDTAGAVRLAREELWRDTAAIASRRAAEVYEMQVLAENIEDDPRNFTRFLILSREPIAPQPPCKTSIVLTLPNVPGALFKALSVFALRDIDLSKIESRPISGRPWEYLFYLDFVESAVDGRGKLALQHLQEIAPYLRVLGSYPRFEIAR